MPRFKSKEEYERFKAQQKGEAPPGDVSPSEGISADSVSVRDEIIRDATAAIAWGTTRDRVIEKLVSKGVDPAVAKAVVEEIWKERQKRARGIGLVTLITGLVLLGIGIWVLTLEERTIVVLGGLMGGGLLLTFRGLSRLVSGQPEGAEEGSTSDFLE